MRQKQSFPKQIKAKKRLYDPQVLQNAYVDVKEHGVSVYKASRIYGIPEQTLRDRVKNKVSIDVVTTGRSPVFTQEEEFTIVRHIKRMANLGYGYTRQEVTNIASDYAVIIAKRTKTNPLTLRWFDGFLSRWPELRILKPRGLEHLRAKAASAETVHGFFTELGDVMAKHDLLDKPHLIFNVDEKGISQNHSPPYVVAGREVHPPPPAVTSGKSSTTTIIGCGSAAGVAVPPFFVFQGARMRDDLLAGTSPGAGGDVSETGWSNGEIFRKYLQQHFMKYIPRGDHQVLLLMDGHTTHVSVGLIEWAKLNRIVLYILPAHTSHLLQPLDVGCYGPLQKIYNMECHKQMRLSSSIITRYKVGELASRAYTKALSPENLQAAFKRTGIYPLNNAAIDPMTLAPAEVFRPSTEVQQITNNGDASQSETRAENFFDSREVSLLQVKLDQENTRKPRRCLSKIVSGHCITENEVEASVRDYVSGPATTKRKTGTPCKKVAKKTRNSPQDEVCNSPIAGPSGVHVPRTIHVSDEQSSNQSDDSEPLEIREDEKCCVCKQFTPEPVRKSNVLIFTQWAQCDVCGHWVHLKYCCKLVAIRRGVVFKCIHCQ